MTGNGRDITATKDQWLRNKINFRVEDFHGYEGRNERVNTLFLPGTKFWDVEKVHHLFTGIDTNAILETRVPQHEVSDRIAWSRINDGIYTAKSGYKCGKICTVQLLCFLRRRVGPGFGD